jgi:hypothetical protein
MVDSNVIIAGDYQNKTAYFRKPYGFGLIKWSLAVLGALWTALSDLGIH